jgi:Allene oxide cyclase barrel like domain
MNITGQRSHQRGAVAVATAATAASIALAGLASSPAADGSTATGSVAQSKTTSLRLVARQDVFQFVDNPPRGDSAGDLVIASDRIYDRGAHHQLGRSHITGIETVPGKTIALATTLALKRGELTLQGTTNEQNNRPFTLAITGGTGAYRNATGVAHVVPVTRALSHLTLSIRHR